VRKKYLEKYCEWESERAMGGGFGGGVWWGGGGWCVGGGFGGGGGGRVCVGVWGRGVSGVRRGGGGGGGGGGCGTRWLSLDFD